MGVLNLRNGSGFLVEPVAVCGCGKLADVACVDLDPVSLTRVDVRVSFLCKACLLEKDVKEG